MNSKILHRSAVLLLALILLASCAGSVFADDSGTDTVSDVPMEAGSAEDYTVVTAQYYEDLSEQMYDLDVRYSDDYFTRDPDVFYQDLAQASFGMALASFRTNTNEGAARDDNIRSFFEQAGFENFESVWYDRDTTADSVSTAMAVKQIDGTTVVAVVICGGGYTREWLGNLTVGSGTEHEGFSSAAGIVEERLTDYMQKNGITGTVRLWMSGYSRAAAVGNLLAARMTESDRFDAVYGYFIATPNNTREPVAYPNIFNIVGQNDPVPQMPLSVWGYGRNGVDLYTPAQESNSPYVTRAFAADDVCSSISGQSFRNNPDLNRQLHVVFEYLGAIFPTAEDYTTILQERMISLYEQHSGGDLLVALRDALSGIENLTPDRQSAADALVEYLNEIIYQYISGNTYQKVDGSWNDTDALSVNLVLEHVPTIYVSWLFSEEDPTGLFADCTGTTRLVIEGKFDLEVWDKDGIVQSISSKNEEAVYTPGTERPESADLIYLYTNNHDGKAVINIPQDREYTIRLNIEKTGTISLFSAGYTYTDGINDVSDVILFSGQKGQCIELSGFGSADGIQVCEDDGREIPCLRQALASDTQSVLAMEQMMSRSFSMGDLLIALAVFLGLPLLLLAAASIVFLIMRKKYRRQAGAAVTVCFAAVTLVLGTGAVFFSVLLPNIRLIPAVFSAIACIFIGINALRCRSPKTALIALALALAGFADYYVFFRRSLLAVNAVVLALLILGGLVLIFFAAKKAFAKPAENTPAET